MAVQAIPDGYHNATPYLYLRGAAAALDFYKQAFGARELMRFPGPGGKLMHAEMQIGNSILMLADENPEMGVRSPQALGGCSSSIMLYVEDVDARFAAAVAAGAKVQRPVKDQFYGDRSGTLEDPFGHVWTIATHKEDVTVEEAQRRAGAYQQQGGS
jgi:PhnB protein